MAKLRHIAVHTPDPEKTAEFYKRVFDKKDHNLLEKFEI
jgi:catechol 2,3-dioxygenase-like lactoylglutathione lyase family enzyme